MLQRSDQIDQLAVALAEAQGELEAVQRDSENPHFRSKYASLGAALKALRQPFAKYGLSVIQIPEAEGPKVVVTTMLLHKSGQFIAGDLTMMAGSSAPQPIGGCITYARRYGLLAMAGLATDDDDAESAMAQEVAQKKIAQMKEAGAKSGMKKAMPPDIPTNPTNPTSGAGSVGNAGNAGGNAGAEGQLGVGPHDITLADRLEASVKQVRQRKQHDPLYIGMLENFGYIKREFEKIDRKPIYYAVLGGNGYEHANEIPDIDTGRKIYKQMAELLADEKGMIDARQEAEAIKTQ